MATAGRPVRPPALSTAFTPKASSSNQTMAPITEESIEQVLSATDIVDLIQSYVPLKRTGVQFRANCPFHDEKTPSFYVNPARQSFRCFGCGRSGDAISFVSDYENLPIMEAVRNEFGDVIAFSGRQLHEDYYSGRYVNSPETSIFRKSEVLFGLDRAKKPILRDRAALLCGGQFDVISCHESGVDHAIAPLGTAFTREHAKLLRRYTNHVLVCFDADPAGCAATRRVFRDLVPEGLSVRVVRMPAGDDPDSYLKSHGIEAFRTLLAEASEFFDFELENARSQGQLDTSAGRAAVLTDCAEMLAMIGDWAALEVQINGVATFLQISSTVLREEDEKLKSKPR